MRISLLATPFQPYDEISRFETAMQAAGKFGACSIFVGSMRDFSQHEGVESMYLEHYPGMTENYLQRIAAEAGQRWELLDILLLHRVGEVRPGDPIVTVAVWSVHRAAAFDACRHIMEELKSRAPFWKKESFGEHAAWVDKNTPG